jgi:hypothetical protein
MKYLGCHLAFLLVCWTATAFAQPRQFGNIAYPAPGNIQLDEGTVEVWLTSYFDSEAKATECGWASFFDLRTPDQTLTCSLMFLTWGKALALLAGSGALRHSYVWSRVLVWKPGEYHCVALSWSGRRRRIYVDGVAGGKGGKGDTPPEVEVEGVFRGDLSQTRLLIGSGYSPIVVDEVRISSVARTPEEIARGWTNAPAADAYTLLLDHCDGGTPEVMAGTQGGPEGGFKVVASRFGNAIQLWRE